VGSLAETAEHLAKSKLKFEPGSKWQYGPGSASPGRVVEVASGKEFSAFLAERIFGPLDMKETSSTHREQVKRLASLYQPTLTSRTSSLKALAVRDHAPRRRESRADCFRRRRTSPASIRWLYGGELNGKRILSAMPLHK